MNDVVAIDVCAYAVMSNHCHLVLYMNTEMWSALSMDEVINRWCELYRGPVVIQQHLKTDQLNMQINTIAGRQSNRSRKMSVSIVVHALISGRR
ncbi:MAG: hypothetical protein O3C28_17080 [Proteobacteria bacterium]|nr:hypothetical protein [Pseudomonadota bacterium]